MGQPLEFLPMLQDMARLIVEHTWIAQVFLVVLATGVARYALKVAMDRFERQTRKTRNLYDDAVVDALRKPAGVGVWVLGVSWAAEVVGGGAQAEIFQYVGRIRDVAIIWLLVWFVLRFIRFVDGHLHDADYYRERRIDPTTAHAISKLLRASVMITGVLLVMQALGFSIAGVLAFGGIGGIAIGFAARDLLANFFGALMIFLDRPFSVGDWIRSPDQEIEGTVEDIGWRLTRIRTFDQRPLYVPNSTFTSITVENPSRMSNRRIYETIGVRYDDVAVLPAIVGDVEAMLSNHPAIDRTRTLMVNFVTFGPSSLDFFVYTFTKTTVWQEFHAIKQDLLFKIADIIGSHGAEIAFPTRTLHMVEANPPPASGSVTPQGQGGGRPAQANPPLD